MCVCCVCSLEKVVGMQREKEANLGRRRDIFSNVGNLACVTSEQREVCFASMFGQPLDCDTHPS